MTIRRLSRAAAFGATLACLSAAAAAFAQSPPITPKPATTAAKSQSARATKKPLPARDPRTGRFLKSNQGGQPTTTAAKSQSSRAMKKPAPARDPKTGRFLKSNKAKP